MTSTAIEEIVADIIVSDLYSRDVPLKGHLGMLDWRLYGFFSKLLMDHKLTGRYKETYLIASKGKARAQHILLTGLGTKSRLTEDKIAALVPVVFKALRKLKAETFVLVPLGWEVVGFSKALKLFLEEFRRQEPLFPFLNFKKMIVFVPEEAKKQSRWVAKLLPFIQKRIAYVGNPH